MQIISIEKKFRNSDLLNILLKIWDSSVRSTHTFLSEENIQNLNPLVKKGMEAIEKLFIAVNDKNVYCAFMGTENDKLEMLFVGAEYRNKGIGGKLVNYAINELNIRFVDVNEQNEQAIGFYGKYKFKLLNRSETDDYGKPFPILHLAITF